MTGKGLHTHRRQERAEEALEGLLAAARLAQIGGDNIDIHGLRAVALAACSAMATCTLAGRRGMVRLEERLRGLALAPELDLKAIERVAHDALTGFAGGRERRPVQYASSRLTEDRWGRCLVYLADPILLTTTSGGRLSPPPPRSSDRVVLELLAHGAASGAGADLGSLGVTPGRLRGRITEANSWLEAHFDVRENRRPIYHKHGRYWPRLRLIMGSPGDRQECASCKEEFVPYECLRCGHAISDRCRHCHDELDHGVVRA